MGDRRMRSGWLLLAALPLMSCEQQIRLGVEQTVSTIPTILEDNVLANLYAVGLNRYAVIAQATLRESVSNAQNSYNYGIDPRIALRAIAITGLTANASNSLSENWVVDPINGSLDHRRLQLLFSYAVRPDRGGLANFEHLVRKIASIGTEKEKIEPLLKHITSYLPPLPPGPFAFIQGERCENGDDYNPRLPLSLKRVCFKGDERTTGQEKASLLVLWSLAVPEFSRGLDQLGASKSGSSGVAIVGNPVSAR